MAYQTEFIKTNCIMRKGRRVHSIYLDFLSAEDVEETFIWNFDIPKEELKTYINDLLSCLNEEEQKLITLRFYEDKTFRDMEEEFPFTFQAAHKKYQKALEKLRERAEYLKNQPRLEF